MLCVYCLRSITLSLLKLEGLEGLSRVLLKQSFRIQMCSITLTKERAKAEGVFYKIPLDFEKSKEISYYPRHEDAHEHSFRLKQSSPVYL